MAYLDNDGVLFYTQQIKNHIPTATSDLANDSGFITQADVPPGASASTSTPEMDSGDGAVGTSTAFARGDHVHPSDTAKVDVDTFSVAMANAQTALNAKANSADVLTMLTGYVEKETGKGLSTNDFTNAEKNKLAAFGSASTYALKSDITNMYKYKGSVATVSALPASDNTTGDVYNVEASGMNYAWNGTAWDALGEIFTITAITNAEITAIVNQVFA